MASPILPAAPAAAPNPFYMNMARKRQMMMDARRAKPPMPPPAGAPPAGAPPVPGMPPVLDQGGGTATGVLGNGVGTQSPAGGGIQTQVNGQGGGFSAVPGAGGPLDGGFAGGMRRPPVAQPPLDGGIAGGMRQPPVPLPMDRAGGGVGNAPGPLKPPIPGAPPVPMGMEGDMGVDPATMEAEKKKAQGNFFKRRQPQIPTPTEKPVFGGY